MKTYRTCISALKIIFSEDYVNSKWSVDGSVVWQCYYSAAEIPIFVAEIPPLQSSQGHRLAMSLHHVATLAEFLVDGKGFVGVSRAKGSMDTSLQNTSTFLSLAKDDCLNFKVKEYTWQWYLGFVRFRMLKPESHEMEYWLAFYLYYEASDSWKRFKMTWFPWWCSCYTCHIYFQREAGGLFWHSESRVLNSDQDRFSMRIYEGIQVWLQDFHWYTPED